MAAKPDIVRIGNAQGFWGDRPDAPAELLRQVPEMDYLTLDYLAEVSMSILAKQRARDASAGFPKDFLGVVASLAPAWRGGNKCKLVTNAGGLNPAGCARAVAGVLREAGCLGKKIGVVAGDDVVEQLRAGAADLFANLETRRPLDDVRDRLVTANAYIGAESVARALAGGADIVITGRVADPSLTVGPCVHHFGWSATEYDKLAGATIAGHLIECGTQVTGGICTDWFNLARPGDIGFPVVEVSADGSCVVTKGPGTGGCVDRNTVTEQLLYEIGDPDNYLSPDATVSFLGIRLAEVGKDRIRVSGAAGRGPPATYKVSATYRAGYRAAGMLTVVGQHAEDNGQRMGQIVLDRLAAAGMKPARSLVECLGSGEVVKSAGAGQPTEVVLRIAVSDPRKDVVEYFARQVVPLVTAGAQGTTGYAEGRPVVREEFGYWPTLIARSTVSPTVEIIEV